MFNAVASFITDGMGGITGGVADSNGVAVGQTPKVNQAFPGGCYQIGTDLRGIMIFNFGGTNTVTFAIAVRADGAKGKLIEFDEASGATSGTRGSGEFRLQNKTAFVASTLNGPFAFAIAGDDANQNRVGVIGVATFNSTALTLSGSIDVSVSGASQANIPVTGSFTAPDTIHGRGTLTLMFTVFIGSPPVATPVTETFAYYIVKQSNELFLQTTNAADINGGHIAANGVVITQTVPAGGFTAANGFTGPVVFQLTGLDSSHGQATNTDIGMVTSTGNGMFTGILDSNADGMLVQNQAISGTVTVQTNGLGVLTVTSPAGLVPSSFAAVAPNTGFLLEGAGTGSTMAGNDVQVGFFQPQTAPTGGFASITGTFIFGSDEPGSGFTPVESGSFALSSPNINGTSDMSAITGTSTGSISGTYTIDNTTGRGVITPSGGSPLVIWVIKGHKAVIMSLAQQNGGTTQNVTILNVEQ